MNSLTKRNQNLDLLRTVAMLFVVLLHFTCYGIMNYGNAGGRDGGLQQVAFTSSGWFDYVITEIFAIFSSTGVNLFVLISGYFLVNKKFNLGRLVKIWVITVFYLFAVAIVLTLTTRVRIGLSDWINFLDPIRTNKYWFVKYYIELVLLAPFLALLAKSMSKKMYQCFLVVLSFMSLTFFKDIPFGNINGGNKGFSLMWFIYLFFVAAYLRLFNVHVCHKGKIALLIVAVMLLQIILPTYIGYRGTGRFLYGGIIFYNGFCFFLSLVVFLYSKDRTYKYTRIERLLVWVSPYTFGVYLIHTHPFIQTYLWGSDSVFADFGRLANGWLCIPIVLLSVITTFVVCILIDLVRTQLFGVARVNAGLDYITNRTINLTNKYFKI